MISCLDFSHEATTGSSSFRNTIKLAPMPDSYDLDRGLLLSVQAIQVTVISSWEIISEIAMMKCSHGKEACNYILSDKVHVLLFIVSGFVGE